MTKKTYDQTCMPYVDLLKAYVKENFIPPPLL